MKKVFSLLLIAALSASALTACGNNSAGVVSAPPSGTQSANVSNVIEETGITYPIEVESDCGTAVIEDEVEAIAVFDLGMLDILDTMGYGDRVVAVTHGVTFPDYLSPYESEQYVNLGGFKTWDEDALVQSNPDLILAGFRQNSSIDTVNAIAPTLYFGPASEDGGSYLSVLERRINAIAAIFGEAEEAEEYLSQINEKVEKIKAFTAENEISFINVTVENGGLSVSGGNGNAFLTNDLGLVNLYESTGEENVRGGSGKGGGGDTAEGGEGGRGGDAESGSGGRTEGEVSEGGPGGETEEDTGAQTAETVAYISEKNPTYIFVFDKDAAEHEEGQPTAQEVIKGAGLEGTDADQNDRIVYLDDSVWYSAEGGLRATIQQLDMLLALFDLA